MKKLTYIMLAALATGMMCTACDDDESYADQKEKERKAIAAFMARDPVVILNSDGDTLLNIPKINVITEETFEEQDSMTNVEKNEFVLFGSTGIYMQIVRKGPGDRIQDGERKQVLCRYWEYNILGDSIQTANVVNYWATNPDIMDVSNNSGTLTASFNTSINGGGAMYMVYSSTSVPEGWIVPLSYVNIGRQKSADEGIAKVRLIVPHSSGQSDATSNVYPCFYEISYQEMRD